MKNLMFKLKNPINLVVLAISSIAFSYYMNWSSTIVFGCILFGCFVYWKQINSRISMNNIKHHVFLQKIVFSVVLSVGIIMGKHIILNTWDLYNGTIDTSYISEYSIPDLIAFMCIFYIVYSGVYFVYSYKEKKAELVINVSKAIEFKGTFFFALMFMAFWLPYYLIYWPGFYFGDTISSVAQALGIWKLNNHFPVAYTLFIAGGLKIGKLFSDSIVVGLGISTILQMLFMAFGLGYFVNWLRKRFVLNKWVTGAICIYLGPIPYMAQYSIAMWKDPIFSVAIVLITISLIEILSNTEIRLKNIISLVTFYFITVFSRNNGIYIIVAISIMSLLALFGKKWRKSGCCILLAGIVTILTWKIVTGPIYGYYEVEQSDDKVESYGIFLAQMARTVAANGNLNSDDLAYMNELLPIEDYVNVYTPGCIDNLKWNPSFKKEVLNENFFKTYFSILKKNPKLCFEAWEFQTFGFWALNQNLINEYSSNITGGVPRNIYSEFSNGLDGMEIEIPSVDETSKWVDIFPYTGKCIPIAYINWLLVALFIFTFFQWKIDKMLALIPGIGLAATLVIASPIYYWPRYEFAVQLLFPLLILLIFYDLSPREKKKENVT